MGRIPEAVHTGSRKTVQPLYVVVVVHLKDWLGGWCF